MGLLSDLLLLPITGPARGLVFILEQIQDEVNAELADEDRIEDELMVLNLRYESGELPEDEYLTQEEAILERIDAAYHPGPAFLRETRSHTDDDET